MDQETLYHFLEATTGKNADEVVARTKVSGKWVEYKYKEWHEWIRELAAGLVDLGAKPGDRIVHIADNRVEWMVISMAITTIGCVDVPRGTDATKEDLEYIIKHTEATMLIMENDKVSKKLEGDWGDLSTIGTLVKVDGTTDSVSGKDCMSLEDLRARGRKRLDAQGHSELEALGNAIKPEDLASIIYTSGTTGTPKGVMLRHRSLVWEVQAAGTVLGLTKEDSTMCFLPPWHIAERLLETAMISVGGAGNFTSVPSIVADLAAQKPTVMLAVPRVWEGFYNKIHDGVQKASPIARGIFNFAKSGAQHYVMAKQYLRGLVAYTEKPPFVERLKVVWYLWWFPTLFVWGGLFSKLILKKITNLLGGRIRLAFSGAGALPHNIDLFFRACQVPIVEAYGMTETTGVSTFRRPTRNKFQTLGPAMDGVEIELRTEKGEVITEPGIKGIAWHKGPHIMVAYYKEPEKSKAVLDDRGFLNSGDLLVRTLTGEFRFAGRAKDTIVLLGGENLEPVPIEDKLKESPYITNVMIVGQDRQSLGAIISPNVEALKEWAASNGKTLPEDPKAYNAEADLRALYRDEIKRLISNKTGFKAFERVTGFYILHKDFEAGQEMTETMKIKRNVVADMYAAEIDGMYRK